jgi:RNA polymerase sigma-70 factor, ECF subfamily
MQATTASDTDMAGTLGLDGCGRIRLLTERESSSEDSAMTSEQALPASLALNVDGYFEQLVAHYQDRLFSFAYRLTANREDAEEVAQDAFVRAYRALKAYPSDRIRSLSMRAWLYQITLNVARNRLRRKKLRLVSMSSRSDEAQPGLDVPDDPETRPDSTLEKAERRANLAALVASLPERYRSTLILRYVEGLRLEEVAAILKQPLGTVKSNAHRAVVALRESLSRSRGAEVRL